MSGAEAPPYAECPSLAHLAVATFESAISALPLCTTIGLATPPPRAMISTLLAPSLGSIICSRVAAKTYQAVPSRIAPIRISWARAEVAVAATVTAMAAAFRWLRKMVIMLVPPLLIVAPVLAAGASPIIRRPKDRHRRVRYPRH